MVNGVLPNNPIINVWSIIVFTSRTHGLHAVNECKNHYKLTRAKLGHSLTDIYMPPSKGNYNKHPFSLSMLVKCCLAQHEQILYFLLSITFPSFYTAGEILS